MQAVVRERFGLPDVVEVREVEKPEVGPDDVLVRVHAASVNPYDWHMMRGKPYLTRLQAGVFRPKRPRLGVDFSGRVEAVGSNVTGFDVGDEVFGGSGGAFAEYVSVPARHIVPKPGAVTHEQAAAVAIAGITALQAIRDKGGVEPGATVMINGAAGGVGTFAVQIAKAFGAEVTGVCSARSVDLVRRIGADHIVDYTTEDVTASGRTFDLIVDNVGTHSLRDYRRVLSPDGTYVAIGAKRMGNWVGPLLDVLRIALASRIWRRRMTSMLARQTRADLEVLGELLANGSVVPVVERTYPLSRAADALRDQGSGHARGKKVLVVSP